MKRSLLAVAALLTITLVVQSPSIAEAGGYHGHRRPCGYQSYNRGPGSYNPYYYRAYARPYQPPRYHQHHHPHHNYFSFGFGF